MSYLYYDPDEWEYVVDANGYSMRRLPSEDAERLKADRRRAHEDRILAEAECIRAARLKE